MNTTDEFSTIFAIIFTIIQSTSCLHVAVSLLLPPALLGVERRTHGIADTPGCHKMKNQ